MYNKENLKLKYSTLLKRTAEEKRIFNIHAYAGLNRSNIEYQKIERKLYLFETEIGEKLWIQYPGKETKTGRPWDFRPKLYIPKIYRNIPDFAFPHIWDDLTEIHACNPEALQVLASVLFRMAFMVDYVKENKKCLYQDVDVLTEDILDSGYIELEIYTPNFDKHLMKQLQNDIGMIRGASIESYLLYNELLVQNEDCKYFFRDTVEKKGNWNSAIGRRNTLLTHLSVIQYIQGKVKFSEIMNRFQRGRGVAPITISAIPEVTGNIINKG